MLKGNTLRHNRFNSLQLNALKQCELSKHINRINTNENILILMNDDGMNLEDVTTLNVKRMSTASRIHLF